SLKSSFSDFEIHAIIRLSRITIPPFSTSIFPLYYINYLSSNVDRAEPHLKPRSMPGRNQNDNSSSFNSSRKRDRGFTFCNRFAATSASYSTNPAPRLKSPPDR